MSEREHNGGRLVVGLFLMALGALLLLDQIGMLHVHALHRLWPLLLIGLGVAKIVQPSERDGRWGGYWLLLVGLYCGASVWHWFGLEWRTSWPLMVIAAGGMIVARALAGPRPRWPQSTSVSTPPDGTAGPTGRTS